MSHARKSSQERYNPLTGSVDPHDRALSKKGSFKKTLLPPNNFEVDLITGAKKDPATVAPPPIGTAHHKHIPFHYDAQGIDIISNQPHETPQRPNGLARPDSAAGRVENRGSEIDPITGSIRHDPNTGQEIPSGAPKQTSGTFRKEIAALHTHVHPILGHPVDPPPHTNPNGAGSKLGVLRKELEAHKNLDPFGNEKQPTVKNSLKDDKPRMDLHSLDGGAVKQMHQKNYNIISNQDTA